MFGVSVCCFLSVGGHKIFVGHFERSVDTPTNLPPYRVRNTNVVLLMGFEEVMEHVIFHAIHRGRSSFQDPEMALWGLMCCQLY